MIQCTGMERIKFRYLPSRFRSWHLHDTSQGLVPTYIVKMLVPHFHYLHLIPTLHCSEFGIYLTLFKQYLSNIFQSLVCTLHTSNFGTYVTLFKNWYLH
jgi:hypothetical protein